MGKYTKPHQRVPVVRFSHSMAFIAYLREFGAPADIYLGKSKLPTLCEDPNSLIHVKRMYTFLATAAHREEPLLGWLVGEKAGDSQLAPALRRRLEAAPTLLMALRGLVSLVRSETSDIDVGLKERARDFVFYTQYPNMRGAIGYEVGQAYQISVFMSVVRLFLGKHWTPAEMGLECERTTHDLAEKLPAFSFTPQSPFGYFTIPKPCLSSSIGRGSNGQAASTDLRTIAQIGELELMRLLLRSYLSDGYIPQAFASELLSTSVRSLTRRLAEYGMTYQQFIDGLRFQVAKEYLDDPDIHIIDVANAVGFRDHGNFTRMFRRISGLTPTEYRRAVCASER